MEEINPKTIDIFAPVATEQERRQQGLEKVNARLYTTSKLIDEDGVYHPIPRPGLLKTGALKEDPSEVLALIARDLKKVVSHFERLVEMMEEKNNEGG